MYVLSCLWPVTQCFSVFFGYYLKIFCWSFDRVLNALFIVILCLPKMNIGEKGAGEILFEINWAPLFPN